MSDNGNWWDPYCPCRVTRKNIVMTFLAMGCFALVTWTIVVTGRYDPAVAANVSYVFIDDTKDISNLNITLTSLKAVKLAEVAQEKKNKAINAVASKMSEKRKTTLRTIKAPLNDTRILCQCMCDLEVSSEDLLEALEFIVNMKKMGLVGTTTTTPSTTIYAPVPDWR